MGSDINTHRAAECVSINLLPSGSEKRRVLGVASIPVAIPIALVSMIA